VDEEFGELSIILVSVKKMHAFDENSVCVCGFKPPTALSWDMHVAGAQATEIIAYYNVKQQVEEHKDE